MARERLLNNPVKVSKEGVETEYPLVRFLDPMSIAVENNHANQRIVVRWAIGRADQDGNFDPLNGNGLSGSIVYDNGGQNHSFDQLVASSGSLGQFQDNIFADLEAAGDIGPGTQQDYAMPEA